MGLDKDTIAKVKAEAEADVVALQAQFDQAKATAEDARAVMGAAQAAMVLLHEQLAQAKGTPAWLDTKLQP